MRRMHVDGWRRPPVFISDIFLLFDWRIVALHVFNSACCSRHDWTHLGQRQPEWGPGGARQVAAGNQVFQVVVENDDIATHISSLLYREKVGPALTTRPEHCRTPSQSTTSLHMLGAHAEVCGPALLQYGIRHRTRIQVGGRRRAA